MDDLREKTYRLFGTPDQVVNYHKETVDVWFITTKPNASKLAYRNFSDSGGQSIDIVKVPGIDDVKRIHQKREDDRRTL